jgi:hypothetical protein
MSAALVVLATVSAVAVVQPAGAMTAPGRQTAARHLPARHAGTRAAQSSLNWSGYVKASTGVTSAAASWHVPTLTTRYAGYSSTWVGVDGAAANDQYLIQTGPEADVVAGHAQYRAWWEVITPTDEAPETIFSTLSIHAGDSMHASVVKNASGTWTMTLRDDTTAKTGTHTAAFAGPGRSAEWIQEDTDVNGYISAAPNWQSVTFSGLTVNGASPKLTARQAEEIVDSEGTREDSTSAPNSTGNGFSVSWLAPGTRTYAG